MTSVFYNQNTRLSISHNDVNVQNLARLFRLQDEFIYLTNDDNRVIIPDQQGKFPSEELFHSHYKVSGSSYTPRDSTLSASSSTFSTSGAGPSQLLPSGRDFRNVPNKAYKRKVFVMELQERELVVSSTIFVNLCETDFTVPRVAEKVAETLNTTVTVTLMDNKNHELQDCPATQDKAFWQQPTRVIRAVTADTYSCFMSSRYKKRRASYSHRELTELEGALTEVVETAKKVARVETSAIILKVDRSCIMEIEKSLECTICKGAIEKPVVGTCCQSLLGCKLCLEEWFSTSESCPKCRSESGRSGQLELKGLDTVFKAIKPLLTDE